MIKAKRSLFAGRSGWAVPAVFAMLSVFAALGSHGQTGSDGDTTFDLNIPDERITETNFQRSTAVSFTAGDLSVQAGVAVTAGRIDVTLRNVIGHVRFVGSIESLDRLFRSRRQRN